MPDKKTTHEPPTLGGVTVVFHSYEPKLASLYYCVDNAGRQCCTASYRLQRQDYDTLLLMVTTAGQGMLETGGKTHAITADTLMFLDCNAAHTYYTSSKEPWQMAWLHFTGSASRAFHRQLCGQDGPVLRPDRSMLQMVAGTVDEIIQLKQGGEYLFDIKASSAISSLLHKLALHYAAPAEGREQAYVTKAIDYIQANYHRDITLGDIAAAVHLSKYYFSKQFKALTGFSPYDYLIRLRIIQSKALLATTAQPVSAIARQVGFNSTTNYITAFHQYENTTPLQYRKNMPM